MPVLDFGPQTTRTTSERNSRGGVQQPAKALGPQANRTGLPDGLKAKMEGTFGTRLDNVRVNKNSSFPAKVGAIATTQGNRIDFAPGHYNPHTAQGQKLIGHEAWHTVQQAQGRVKPTLQMKTGHMVNDSSQLEAEADRMGERVVHAPATGEQPPVVSDSYPGNTQGPIQRTAIGFEVQMLKSKITLGTPPSEVKGAQDLTADYPWFGKSWTCVRDGENIEMVTEPHTLKAVPKRDQLTQDAFSLMETMGEITQFGDYIRRAGGKGPFQIGGKWVQVERGDTHGQIQINTDLPLDRYSTLVARSSQVMKQWGTDAKGTEDVDETQLLRQAFGADGVFRWTRKDTTQELAAVAEATKTLEAIDDEALFLLVNGVTGGVQSLFGPQVQVPDEEDLDQIAGNLRGLLGLLAHHVIHEADYHKEYVKDQTMVHKVLLNSIIDKLVTDGQIETFNPREVKKILLGVVMPVVKDKRFAQRLIQSLVFSKDPVWNEREAKERLSDSGYSGPSDLRQKLVVELRRAAPLPIAKWTPFVLAAFDYFMIDPTGNYE
ncbi:MAG: DUF4157 domain-containing protein [Bacteroidota bacterium]